MLKGLAKAKALKELKEIRQSKASLKGLALAKALKRLRELRNELGLIKPIAEKSSAGNVIDTWDSEQADANLQNLLQKHSTTQACKLFINQYLINKVINSVAGLVEFNAKARGKLVDKMRTNKALAIARIPEILIDGEIIGDVEDNDGHRTDSLNHFITVQKKLEFKTTNPHQPIKKIKATIKLATNINGTQTPYYLGAGQFDAIKMTEHLPHSRFFTQNSATASCYKFSHAKNLPQFDKVVNDVILLEIIDFDVQDLTYEKKSTHVLVAPDSNQSTDETSETLVGRNIPNGEITNTISNQPANVNNRPTPQNKTALSSDLEPFVIDDSLTPKERRKAIETWLRENLQGKTITTVDGKSVRFNGKSTSHIAHDVAVKKNLIAQAVTKIVDVLTQGEFIERQELYKERKDRFVAFHVYRKWVDIDDLKVHLQVKAGELDNGLIEAGDGLIVYSAKNDQFDSMEKGTKSIPHWQNAQLSGEAPSTLKMATPPTTLNSVSINSEDDHLLDDISTHLNLSQDDYVFLEILEIRQNPNKLFTDILNNKYDSPLNADLLAQVKSEILKDETQHQIKDVLIYLKNALATQPMIN